MTRRLCSATGGWLTIASLLAVAPARGQGSTSVEGALFLLRPIGARAVGLGQAVVARQDGSEAIWWNPAALAALTRPEFALHHSQDFFATGDALALVMPSRLLGTFAISVDVEDYGEQENTIGPDVPSTGTILSRSFVFAGTYATTIGKPFRAGLTFKVAQLRLDCTGPCDFPTSVAQTVAVDGGVQYDVGASQRLTLGASIRNTGLALQVQDSPQSDPLPTRVQVGASYRYPLPERYAEDADLRLSLDVLDGLHVVRPLARAGAEFIWQKKAVVRAGYVVRASGSEAGGPSLGLGLVSKNLHVDIARELTGFSADAGQSPTFLSLRIQF